ncbi:TsaE protein [Candidatus Rhodobacter oscarellae]|uniref:tRNA threonylcarbamoyladenosine biosynthesis protein TsaE n=1 Tax=Candidatus Rhodobacter oscarellae TaxID=1675527 RepID=A0A0J9E867_9RHOB|nr:tRNA (adenosine(37)-N6)-threonylcarbamoyltransferase complex ATPase subunit type 1 TsaE [Candidatus Rhodobacter lobularis]KMW58922.1 TsaE protein [Candidatus Rhodobacter lobularis]
MQQLTRRVTSAQETTDIAQRLAPLLGNGDTILLSGDLGAGKSHFARSLIQARMAAMGAIEDVPSPTFTLVQSYALPDIEIWHADLYRLSDPDEVLDLGLEDALMTALCLIEWPDRLDPALVKGAATLELRMTEHPGERDMRVLAGDPRWLEMFRVAFDG